MEITLRNYTGPVQYKKWKRGDPYPEWSDEVGVDTETELITDANLTPPLVVMGIYNKKDNTTYIASWEDAKDLLQDVLKRDILLYFANVGFDYFELACPELTDAVARNKVVDILVRAALKDISTIGFITTYSLVDVCKHYLDYEMDKHEDQGDKAARVTFRRDTPVTEEQYVYLAIDCMTTYYGGRAICRQPTETANTRGSVVLYHISKNGLHVDKPIFDHFRNLLIGLKEKFRQELLTYGFPDPELKNQPAESVVIDQNWKKFILKWFDKVAGNHQSVVTNFPNKTTAKRALVYLIYVMENGGVLQEFAKYLALILQEKKQALSKKETAFYNSVSEKYELDSLETTIKRAVWPVMLETILTSIADHKTVPEAFVEFDKVMQDHQDWWVKPPVVSPQKFLQAHLAELEKQYPGLVFDRTEKAQQLKCSKADAWKLSDAGCKDPFLISYINYIHYQKYLSTYLNPEFIRSDGKVRTKFGMVTTARTSSTKPNVQNLPSRGDLPLKNMYKPEQGLFCSTDFSFAELVALAENCIQKYGFSVLGQIINADVCPHYFFAGVMLGKIKADVSFCSDPEKVAEMVEFLHKNVTKQERQLAKALNFGLPGAMSAKRLYRHLRENGIVVTLKEATDLRAAWLHTFPEMARHMDRQPMKVDPYARYGSKADIDETGMEDTAPGKKYKTTTITGFVRSRASFNAAANTDFQNPVAILAKEALWQLEQVGLGDRLVNFVHDEVDYWLYPTEVKAMVPIIEQLWLAPSKVYFPHVKLKCETEVGIRWDKGNTPYPDLKWDENNCPILEDAKYVRELKGVNDGR